MKKLKTILLTLFIVLLFIGCNSEINKVKESSFEEFPTMTIESFFENRENISDVEWEFVESEQGEKKVLLTLEYDFSENKAMDDFADYYSGIDFTFDAKGENFIISNASIWYEFKDESLNDKEIFKYFSEKRGPYSSSENIMESAEFPSAFRAKVVDQLGEIIIRQSIIDYNFLNIEKLKEMGYDLSTWEKDYLNILEYFIHSTLKDSTLQKINDSEKVKLMNFVKYLKENKLEVSNEFSDNIVKQSIGQLDFKLLENYKFISGYDLKSWNENYSFYSGETRYGYLNILEYTIYDEAKYHFYSIDSKLFDFLSNLKKNGLNISNDFREEFLSGLEYDRRCNNQGEMEMNEYSSKWNEIFKK